jgi:hypothetical protein
VYTRNAYTARSSSDITAKPSHNCSARAAGTAANSSIVARVIDAHHADASAAAERGLHIRENPTVGFYVEGLRAYVAATLHDANSLIAIGLANRAVAPTSQVSTNG